MFLAQLVAAAVWAVVGILLWVPMIVRVFALQTGLLLVAALTDTDTSRFDKIFDQTMKFYSNGFARIFQSGTTNGSSAAGDIELGKAFSEIAWATIFYLLSLVAYQAIWNGSFDFPSLAFGSADSDPIFVSYANASAVQDFDYRAGILSGSQPARVRFSVLRVSAPSEDSPNVRLKIRVCNVGSNTLGMNLDLYFTDTASQTIQWRPIELNEVDPGACREELFSQVGDRRWREINFGSGDFTFRFDDKLTRVRAQ
ncbi:hypothetical protein [Tabrizicola soli]|uniref:DUF4352 domain-containing protein n=1 Tax=Tabrizicola soli TaxID=2185115 RepID=A0ABV7DQM7_9RHOB|nr:hypothetical protein [Tabrizicola soli]